MYDTQATAADVGHHNADLPASTLRVIEGATWKRQRIVTVLPAAATIPTRVALSHRSLIFPPNQPAHWVGAIGCEVGDAYSRAVDEILAHPELSTWEYLLTIEADNLVQPDAVVRLIRRMEEHPELAAISGLYWCKGPGGPPHIWGDVADPVLNFRPQAPDPKGGLVECCGLSMGLTLHRMSMLRDLKKRGHPAPWWRTTASMEEGTGTQDLHFWTRVRPLGFRCAVDCSVLVGHLDHEGKFGPPGVVW